MNKNEIDIVKRALKLLEKKKWQEITISQLLSGQKKLTISKKEEVLTMINRYFDFLLKKNISNIDSSTKKDMLFEVLMARLDILNAHRNSIKKLISYFFLNPQKFLIQIPSFIETIILIATFSNISVSGIKGTIRIKSIFILYLLILYTWNIDETESLEKTMTTLDKYLNNIEKFVDLF